MPAALATIVVAARETFSHAMDSLQSIYAFTRVPFSLVYVDGNSPPNVSAYLKQQAAQREFKLLRVDHYLSGNESRNLALPAIDTKYVVFMDNDVHVMPGWLGALIACAEETGASIVEPVYCGGSFEKLLVYAAAPDVCIRDQAGMRTLHESANHAYERLSDIRPQLSRKQCSLAKFQCMLVRRDVFDRIGALDASLMSFFENVDLSIAVNAAAGSIWFEPRAVVTHFPPPPLAPMDMPLFFLRWSDAWLRPSIRRFCYKHGVRENDDGVLGHVRYRDKRRHDLMRFTRASVRRLMGHRALRLADAAVDRLFYGGIVEQLIVAKAERQRRQCRSILPALLDGSAQAEPHSCARLSKAV